MKRLQSHFGVAATIVPMFAALSAPAADGRREHLGFRGVPTFDATAFFFYNDHIDERIDNWPSTECRRDTPAGGFRYWIDDDIASLTMQPAERLEMPPDGLRMFVWECDDTTESANTSWHQHAQRWRKRGLPEEWPVPGPLSRLAR